MGSSHMIFVFIYFFFIWFFKLSVFQVLSVMSLYYLGLHAIKYSTCHLVWSYLGFFTGRIDTVSTEILICISRYEIRTEECEKEDMLLMINVHYA